MTEKSLDQYFAEWHQENFGFGYGTGDEHTIRALKMLMEVVGRDDADHGYDYRKLEAALTPPVAWLLINALCRAGVNIIEYGTSPRYGWLTPQGVALRDYVKSRTFEELLEASDLLADFPCSPEYCNCGPNGHSPVRLCHNPFWVERQSK